MGDEQHQERAETQELIELPVSLENLDAKMNHVITHLFITERLCNRAAEAAEKAEKISSDAKTAATNAANSAVQALQSREPLSRKERFSTVFAGAAFGGALAGILLSLLGVLGTGASVTSCARGSTPTETSKR
jgi:hypothetical protein